ncbi:hypothetical protein EEZ25_19450 [Micromonospora aurantiaca]|nr:hypothetical protein EEZ25_19450 [Micromonospora aurantiaca]
MNVPFARAQTATRAAGPGLPALRVGDGVAFLWAVWDTVRSVSLPRDQVIALLEARSWMSRPAR